MVHTKKISNQLNLTYGANTLVEAPQIRLKTTKNLNVCGFSITAPVDISGLRHTKRAEMNDVTNEHHDVTLRHLLMTLYTSTSTWVS